MFHFDRDNPSVIFLDKRRETHTLCDGRALVIEPDIEGDFTNLPFRDERFAVVVFDPPHLVRAGKNSWLAKKYGRLEGDWREDIRKGFAECFRVLRPLGVLLFKWNERDVSLSQILALTDEKPLVGNRFGKRDQSHWIVFVKSILPAAQVPIPATPASSLNELKGFARPSIL